MKNGQSSPAEWDATLAYFHDPKTRKDLIDSALYAVLVPERYTVHVLDRSSGRPR